MTSQTHKRPTISLCLIAKDEQKNIPRLLDSVKDCFDEIVLVDTGSKDNTRQIGKDRGCKVFDFAWVDDFSKARQFAFDQATCDYIAWIDCDDILWNRENFIHWRDHAMEFSDMWFNSYHYAVDKSKLDLPPHVSFVRERVIKRSCKPKWVYQIHEGLEARPEFSRNYAVSWCIKHMRDDDDVKQDRSRNIRIMEKMRDDGTLNPRMQFYYGKELYENGRPSDAIPQFDECLKRELEQHDRILAIQHGGFAALGCFDSLKDEPQYIDQKKRYLKKAIDYAHQGMQVDPNRAEFYIIAADSHLRDKNPASAAPYFAAAKGCLKNFDTPYDSPVYSFRHLYGEAPSIFLAKVYAQLGMLDKAKAEAKDCWDKFKTPEAESILKELEKFVVFSSKNKNHKQTDDIVITCPPSAVYDFDEELYKTKAMGGSETALIQMARLLRAKTGRPVKVFNPRKEKLLAESGVEYLPSNQVNEYMRDNRPAVHIAWRHNIKLSDAPTYLWQHDLWTPGVETVQNFDKMMCLSKFSKEYIMGLQGVPENKIILTRNGIDPEKFNFTRKTKDPNKVVWLSSPDRGLKRAIRVVEMAREVMPDLELHVYYGIENLHKYGPVMSALADELKKLMAERPWVKYHGFTEQSKMNYEVSDAVAWVHPCDFIETFCITALECLANGIYPVTRRLGALQNTLAAAESMGDAILLDHDCITELEFQNYRDALLDVLQNKRWKDMHPMHLDSFSWSSVADEWIEFMGLKQTAKEQAK